MEKQRIVEIIVVRHGISEADIWNRCEGRADFSLTALGLEQAQQLADWMKHAYKLDAIFSSPLERAKQTATAISLATQTTIVYDEDLMELNNGVIAGMLREEALRKYPIPVGGRKRYDAIEAGETDIHFRARAETFIAKLLDQLDHESAINSVCIVSHGGMISMLFRSFMNLPYHTEVYVPTGDTGVHIWRYSPSGKKIIAATNLQDHLR
ncbi:histidine phosphatase family protein [Paenibacillus sp. JCM 10914]|uniref:histidine phosphatase family protein n=1 Tax=Paenibacillus sp. JCM 10914 TaxID=1236974 RepID=UPI0003CC7ECE|nr:histidine phosphatase family protein [Paenibacillus sp. JCM 10914]GAE08884.1 phosphoglycerate mutase family protein [Paenibacillus sp. JCM 10914]